MTSHLIPCKKELSDLLLVPDFIMRPEESNLVGFIGTQTDWTPLGKKQRLSFGWTYGLSKGTLRRTRPIPRILYALALRLQQTGMMPEVADQIVAQKYLPGQGISAHTDKLPQFEPKFSAGFGPVVVSLSLLAPCVMRFTHETMGRGPDIVLAPRSALAIAGEARDKWMHEILGRTVRELRLSITFRTVVFGV